MARRQYIVANGIADEAVDFEQSYSKSTAHVLERDGFERHMAWNHGAINGPTVGSRAAASTIAVLERKPLRILFVGILRESKGLRTLIDACGLLHDRGLPFEVEIAGEFQSREFELNLKQRIMDLGIEAQVRFLGVVSGHAKISAFRRADVFCFPTFYESETFPTVLLEAMSFGLPVVATRWRGIPEIVSDGDTGLLVDPRNPLSVADALAQLHANPQQRLSYAAAGRKKFLCEFTADKFCRRMEVVFVETANS